MGIWLLILKLSGPDRITCPARIARSILISRHQLVESGILSLAGVERLTGINQKQIWAYLHGTKPRKEQVVRLENGFRNLQADLDAVFISAS